MSRNGACAHPHAARVVAVVVLMVPLAVLGDGPQARAGRSPQTLREAATRAGRLIGTNTDKPIATYEPIYGQTIAREFNLLSTTAPMWMTVHPERDTWDFAFMDSVVAFAQASGMDVLGTPLVWGVSETDARGRELWNNYPRYLREGLSRTALLTALKGHVMTVVSRYRGRVKYWVVANEILDEAAEFRRDVFVDNLGGMEVLEAAFRAAHAADPAAVLILNEGNTGEIRRRADRLYEIVKGLRDRRVPVHVVGMQMHWPNFEPTPLFSDTEADVRRLAALGVKVHFTEVDVMVGHLPVQQREAWQAGLYERIVNTCLKFKQCEAITFWGFTDKHNWYVDDLGYTDEQPLLFDMGYGKKPAYDAVMRALSEAAGRR